MRTRRLIWGPQRPNAAARNTPQLRGAQKPPRRRSVRLRTGLLRCVPRGASQCCDNKKLHPDPESRGACLHGLFCPPSRPDDLVLDPFCCTGHKPAPRAKRPRPNVFIGIERERNLPEGPARKRRNRRPPPRCPAASARGVQEPPARRAPVCRFPRPLSERGMIAPGPNLVSTA